MPECKHGHYDTICTACDLEQIREMESSRSSGCSTALRDDYEKLKEAASCIRHWHDSGDDGMVVSAEHVRKLWAVLEEIQ